MLRRDIKALADRYIPTPGSVDLVSSRYTTDNIIDVVLSHYEKHKGQLKRFAPYLQGSSVYDTCRNIWQFWRQNIRYAADDAGAAKQLVKSPAAVWADKFCDCKSFSLATVICLQELGIKCVFRFVSFNQSMPTIPTHVYVVAFDGGSPINIDCCLPQFNQEPMNVVSKYDYLPAGLYAVNGIDGGAMLTGRRKVSIPHRQRGCLCLKGAKTQAELELLLHKQRLELEQQQAVKVHGIGSLHDNAYEIEIAAVNNAIYEIANPELKQYFSERILKPAVEFIGDPETRDSYVAGKAARQARKLEKAKKANAAGKAVNQKQAKRLEKLNITVKKKKDGLLKKVLKVVTAPFRLIAKGVLEVSLPKSAPVFLYLFLDEKILPKAPDVVKAKRAKAVKIADVIVNKIGMKRDHFMGIVRNGIMNHLGDSPENIISKWIRDANFQIGLAPVFATAGKFLVDIVKKVGGAKMEDMQNNAPDPTDWISAEEKARQEMAAQVQQSGGPAVPIKSETASYNQATGGGGFNYNTPGYNTNYSPDDEVENKYGTEGKTLDNVTLPPGKKAGDEGDDINEGDDSGNGLLIAAGLGIALLALSGGKKGN